MVFKEDFLHYLWRFRRLSLDELTTVEGEYITILHPGAHNHNGGPDFHDARIRIDRTLWAGNVEIHINASDWYRHNHNLDRAYDNVILHVVFNADVKVFRPDGNIIPCLEIKDRIDVRLIRQYRSLMSEKTDIACAGLFEKVDSVIKTAWLERLMIERLESKTKKILDILNFHKNDWEAAFYEVLAAGFGLKENSHQFGLLARTLPLNIIRKHQGQGFQLEALFFGQAGFLETDFEDEYPKRLQQEFLFLKKKYRLTPLKACAWKFLRMRPSGFPTIRIARFATFLAARKKLFSFLETAMIPGDFMKWVSLPISEYWSNHYRFDQMAKRNTGAIGHGFADVLLINVVVPFMFLYGKIRSNEKMRQKAVNWYEAVKAENNKITRLWQQLDVNVDSAGLSQALIHLKSDYCDKKRCLNCAIGVSLLRSSQ
ncbi:MAG: DUF2851 family protein [Bacteroidota bacterium]